MFNKKIKTMKKNILIMAICALVAVGFTSCNQTESTKEEMLTQKKGWVLTAATSEPPYQMLSGDKYADIFNKGYFADYELDDVYYYDAEGGALRVDAGKKVPSADEVGYTGVLTLGVWTLNYPTLKTKVPSFYDKKDGVWVMDDVKILELTEETLKYEYTWNAAKKKGAKADGDEIYTFTLTFSKKK